MNPDLFARSLRGAGLAHDVDLFVEAYRGTAETVAVVILVDAIDETLSAEAMIPALRYLSHLGVSPLLVARGGPTEGAGFGDRLARLGALTRTSVVTLGESWKTLLPKSLDDVHLVRVQVAADDDQPALLAERLRELGSRKLVLLDSQGMVFRGGRPSGILEIGSSADDSWIDLAIDPAQAELVWLGVKVTRLLADTDISVSLASPLNILPELFTVRGAGTLLRTKARFSAVRNPRGGDAARLKSIIERAFGRPLRETPSPFETTGAWAVTEDAGRAAALLIPTPIGDYMSKFAVIRECQGSGIGQDLWAEVLAHSGKVFWRARNANPINPWYARITDGMVRGPEWTFYWRGLTGEEIPAARDFATRQPDDFAG